MTKAKTYNHGVPWEKEFNVTQAYSVNGTIYISGQFSHNMQGEFVGEGDIKVQTRQTFENLDRVLAGFGVTKSNIADLEIYLTRPQEDFEPFLSVYKEYVGDHRSAVTLIGVSGLAFPEQLVEIRAVAHTD
ncbi:RidA family protein [Paenibacillus andongensis]|uniref:RidA family protein n=1 Tax=Paenibacillus andongensis TaxID=2975482 RepID=UPI0021BA67DE|nr:RidA family protein [Paenibacillus andongensis]